MSVIRIGLIGHDCSCFYKLLTQLKKLNCSTYLMIDLSTWPLIIYVCVPLAQCIANYVHSKHLQYSYTVFAVCIQRTL